MDKGILEMSSERRNEHFRDPAAGGPLTLYLLLFDLYGPTGDLTRLLFSWRPRDPKFEGNSNSTLRPGYGKLLI
jgi:hypothetical protein